MSLNSLFHRGKAGAASVGVFDSGLGGLTVVQEIMRQAPSVSIIYLADMAHVPYGPRSADEIQSFAHAITGALLKEGSGAILAACNMSSALALPFITDLPVPLIGMIRPGVSAAFEVWRGGPIGVLATEGTCMSGAYPETIRAERPAIATLQSPCPDFVPLVESGETDGPDARNAAERYLRPLLAAGCQTIILGCTHYPWLLPVLRDVAGPDVQFVDPARAAVETWLRQADLPSSGTASPRHRFATTAHPERLETGVRRWLHREISAERWPLFDRVAV